jgi:DNA-binding NarL/FixJ family response regulator
MIDVLVVDDEALVRDAFVVMLSTYPDLAVVGSAPDGICAVEEVRRCRPDVVIMDVRMPRLDGVAATSRILSLGVEPSPRVLILTTFDLDQYVYAALRAGASGFLLKDTPRDRLVEGIRTIASGDLLLAPSVTRRLVEQFTSRPHPSGDEVVLRGLSPREREVLLAVARGLSNAEIADELVLSEATVKTHVAHVLQKLGVRDRVHAVIAAYEAGLMTGPRAADDGGNR